MMTKEREEPLSPPDHRRVLVGTCPSCGHPMHSRLTGVRASMRLTCKCGCTCDLVPDESILRIAEESRARHSLQRRAKDERIARRVGSFEFLYILWATVVVALAGGAVLVRVLGDSRTTLWLVLAFLLAVGLGAIAKVLNFGRIYLVVLTVGALVRGLQSDGWLATLLAYVMVLIAGVLGASILTDSLKSGMSGRRIAVHLVIAAITTGAGIAIIVSTH